MQLLLGTSVVVAVQVLPAANVNSAAATPLKPRLVSASAAVPGLVMTSETVPGVPTTAANTSAVLLMLKLGAGSTALPARATLAALGAGSLPLPA